MSAAEDLASSWRPELAVELPAPVEGLCPDADGDGFAALSCTRLPPAERDCDDADPAVTPATERLIPAGPFLMGSASDHAGTDEKPVHVVHLSDYCLDRLEVSADAFSAWLRQKGRSPAGADSRSLLPDGSLEPGRAGHPAEGVTWEEARDFCLDQKKALPTEAQWEKAARGGCERGEDPTRCDPGDLRPYPWGVAAPDCTLANHQLSTQGMPRLCVSDTLPVDSLPEGAGPYGQLHLSGNAWEFVADPYHPTVYTEAPRTDPGGPEKGDQHVLRGGGWNTFSTNMRVANRFSDLVMGTAAGFRCARPTVAPIPDPVAPLELVKLSGTIQRDQGSISGRALYITAFDAADADAQGRMAPGRSPVAEKRIEPAGASSQPFEIAVPAGRRYLLSAALDDGTGGDKTAFISSSGSGGFGAAEGNPIAAEKDVEGIRIKLLAPPPNRGPGAGPGQPPGPPPGSPPGPR